MKRFMLVSLMSCLLVGQTSCDWKSNTTAYLKGLGISSALTAICGAFAFGVANKFNSEGKSEWASKGSKYRGLRVTPRYTYRHAACNSGMLCGSIIAPIFKKLRKSDGEDLSEDSLKQKRFFWAGLLTPAAVLAASAAVISFKGGDLFSRVCLGSFPFHIKT